jgi:hypothetical protein
VNRHSQTDSSAAVLGKRSNVLFMRESPWFYFRRDLGADYGIPATNGNPRNYRGTGATFQNFATFEDYFRQRWNMTHRRANQLIGVAEVVQNLGTEVHSSDAKRGMNSLTFSAQLRDLG